MFEPNHILPQTTENIIDFTKSTTVTSTKSQQIPNVSSFASKTAAEYLPKRELAIVVNTIESIPQIEYLIALSKIISPKHITFSVIFIFVKFTKNVLDVKDDSAYFT